MNIGAYLRIYMMDVYKEEFHLKTDFLDNI